MGNFRPYREPCHGQNPCFPGSKYRHFDASLNGITNLKNATHVPIDTAPGWQSPFPRNNPLYGTTCTPEGNNAINDISWPCGPWPEVFGVPGSASIPGNAYAGDGTHTDYATCRNYGFNVVQAARNWHGMWGFDVDATTGIPCAGGAKQNYKYLQMTVLVEVGGGYTQTQKTYDTSTTPETLLSEQTFENTGGYTKNLTVTVNPQSGEVTQTNPDAVSTLEYINIVAGVPSVLQTDMFFALDTSTVFGGVSNMFNNWGWDCTTLRFANSSGPTDYQGTIAEITAAFAAWSVTQGVWGSVAVDTLTRSGDTIELHLTGTPGTWSYVPTSPPNQRVDTVGTGTCTFHLKVTLSQKNYLGSHTTAGVADGVYDDVCALLGQWRFDNPQHFPTFRHKVDTNIDPNVTLAPFVTRNEVATEATPHQFNPRQVPDYSQTYSGTGPTPMRDWFDPNCYQWVYHIGHSEEYGQGQLIQIRDGTIRGAPLALGYGPVFDYRHANYHDGEDTPYSFGAFTNGFLPPHTPQWTPDVLKSVLWPCAFVSNNAVWGSTSPALLYSLVAQKWCETLMQPPAGSMNMARPFGADRKQVDWTKATQCIDGIPADADGVLLDGSVTIPDADLLFPNCPGFGGRLAVTAVGNTLTFSAFTGNTILAGDTIDILNDSGGVLASAVAVASPTGTSVDVGAHYASAAWIVPHLLNDGATSGQKWYWDDTDYKNSYVVRQWTLDSSNTVLTHSKGQGCLSFYPCYPSIVCCSPNGEEFSNGVVIPFSPAAPDGSWLCQFEKWMDDPLFFEGKACNESEDLVPIVQCYAGCEDGGSCEHLIPQVEAMCFKPGTNGTTGAGMSQSEAAPDMPTTAAYDYTADMAPPAKGSGALQPWNKYDLCYAP